MPSHTTAVAHHDLLHTIEPLFIEHFKAAHGASPSLTELKQHLVHTV